MSTPQNAPGSSARCCLAPISLPICNRERFMSMRTRTCSFEKGERTGGEGKGGGGIGGWRAKCFGCGRFSRECGLTGLGVSRWVCLSFVKWDICCHGAVMGRGDRGPPRRGRCCRRGDAAATSQQRGVAVPRHDRVDEKDDPHPYSIEEKHVSRRMPHLEHTFQPPRNSRNRQRYLTMVEHEEEKGEHTQQGKANDRNEIFRTRGRSLWSGALPRTTDGAASTASSHCIRPASHRQTCTLKKKTSPVNQSIEQHGTTSFPTCTLSPWPS